jgi:isoquinoline 1-oxidoreductase beta subunit
MTDQLRLDRRSFLVSAAAFGGGLAVGIHWPTAAVDAQTATAGAPPELTAWVVIQPDDRVVIRVARSEMGQGSLTALPMLVAEELECDWAKVKAEYASPNEHVKRKRIWGSMSTGGSQSIRGSQDYLRKAGATAREMLIMAAAQSWNVAPGECSAKKGVIAHKGSGRTVRFGEVANAAAKLEPPKDVQLKDPKDWTLIGTRQKRLDTRDKITGRPIYGIDVRVPGMVYGSIRQSPVFGGKVRSVDEAAIKGMKGVEGVVNLGDAVVVLAKSWWQAEQAIRKLPVQWDEGANGKVTSASIKDFLQDGLAAPEAAPAKREGDVGPALASAKTVVEAEYYAPFQNHATLEPMNCTARINAQPDARGVTVEVWVSTQNGEASLAAAAAAAEVPLEQVEVHKMQLGGGFGRRGAFQDYVTQAVKVAKAAGKPVKLLWSREEDMQHGFYRPVSMAKWKAGIDAEGNLAALQLRVSGHSILNSVFPSRVSGGLDMHFLEGLHGMPYKIPNRFVDYAMRNTHVPVGFWRAVNHTQNAFFKECFIDEVAHAAGKDPYEFRLKMLDGKTREIGVLKTAAEKAGWGKPLAAGVFRGIALNESYGSYAAQVVEAAVKSNGEIAVLRVICAIDSGYVVNRDTVEAQVEGSIVYGLTAALFGEITIKDGRVEQKNFDDYEMLKLAAMPKVETYAVPSGGFWGGIGEPAVPPVAPALCNAIFAATGKRIRSLPLKNHGFRLA